MSKPTIVGVPGAWHSPEVYDGVFERLKDQGYATLGVTLPSVGAVPAHQNFDADLDTIRKELVRLVEEEGKEVVLVTHSYSCLLCSHAPEGLGLKERTAKGLKGGVMRLVYIQGFAVPEGFNAMELSSEVPDWIQMDFEVSRQI